MLPHCSFFWSARRARMQKVALSESILRAREKCRAFLPSFLPRKEEILSTFLTPNPLKKNREQNAYREERNDDDDDDDVNNNNTEDDDEANSDV